MTVLSLEERIQLNTVGLKPGELGVPSMRELYLTFNSCAVSADLCGTIVIDHFMPGSRGDYIFN